MFAALLCTVPAVADEYYYDSNQLNTYSDTNYSDSDNSFTLVNDQRQNNDQAQQSLRLSQDKPSDHPYARKSGEYYFYAGYLYSYHINLSKSHGITASPAAGISSISISPKSSLADQYQGVEVGFATAWSRHFDLQIAYIQQFKETKRSSILSTSASTTYPDSPASLAMKGLSVDFAFILNPDDRFRIAPELGMSVEHYHETATVNSVNYTNDATEINPTAGLEFAFQLSKRLAIRANVQYAYHPSSDFSSGEVNGMLGFSMITN